MSDVCKKCGNNLYDNKVNCPFCGEPIKSGNYTSTGRTTLNSNSNNVYSTKKNSNNNNRPQNSSYRASNSNDSGGFGWGLLGFCFPIVGIVLYFVWNIEKPITAKACLNGALISIVISVFFSMVSACS